VAKAKDSQAWQTVKLGDVTRQIKHKVSDPVSEDITHYLPGGGIRNDSFLISEWQPINDGVMGPAFHMCFLPGHTLYKSRVPHGVGVADRKGICANTTYIIEANPEQLLPELLPFILITNEFRQFEKENNRGSTNLFINYNQITKYIFSLPPVDEQRRIADLLWAADDSITEYQSTLDKLHTTTTSFLETQIANGLKNGWRQTLFDELLTETQYGISKKSGLQREGTVPILGIPNVVAGNIDLSKLAWVEVSESEFEKYRLNTGDILIVRTNGNPNYVGRCVALKDIPENSVYASYLIRLRVLEDRANPSFIEAILNSRHMRRTLMNEIRSSAGNYNLNTQGIRKQKIPLPPLSGQDSTVKKLNEFNMSKGQLESHIENQRKLKTDLLNTLLSN